MAQPTAYARIFDFENFSTNSPSDQQPGAQLEAEFDALVVSIASIRVNMALLQKDDGALANEAVHKDSFDAASLALMGGSWTPEGDWATTTSYDAGDVVDNSGRAYVCYSAHTSGTFSTDLPLYWTALTNTAVDNENAVLGAQIFS